MSEQEDRLLTLAEAAERAGVKEPTWRAYVSRGQAPKHDERDPETGRPLWRESTLSGWARPGRGRWGLRGESPASP